MGLTFAFGRGGTRPPLVTPDIEAPSAPTGLTASSVTQTTLTLTWSASTDNVGVVGYDVYNGATLAETVTDLTASITGLTASTQYNFTVRAKDAAGNISEPSNVETVTTLDAVVDDSIYIDPTNSASGRNGTIGNPYNSFTEAGIADNTTYLWKAGTTQTTSTVLNLSNRTGVIIGQYGSGDKPKFQYTGSSGQGILLSNSTNCTLSFIDAYTDLSNSLISLVQITGGSGNTIYNCTIHNVRHTTLTEGMGIRGGGTDLKILNCEVYDCGADGMYLTGNVNLEVGYCNIYNVSQDYAGIAKGFRSIGGSAGGDGIQLDGVWDNFHIHHCTIDRTDQWTGNKFCLIQSSLPASNPNSYGLVEHCVFKTDASKNVPWAAYTGMGDGVTYRYNTFLGNSGGIRVTGKYALNYLIHHNVFINCSNGVGIAYGDGDASGSPVNTRVLNNVFHKVTSYNIWIDRTSVISRNNIHFPDGASGTALHNYGSGIITHSNNCYNASYIGTGGTAPNSVIGDPLFVDALNGDFHLQAESPCRNSGIDVGLIEDYYGITVPQEAFPAIGVAEYAV